MIQVHTFRVPLRDASYTAVAAKICGDAYEAVANRHPSLLAANVDTAPGGWLELRLRVSGHDRWRVQNNARLFAATLLRRAGLAHKEAEWVCAASEPNARHLTKEQGREFSHAPRGPAAGPL